MIDRQGVVVITGLPGPADPTRLAGYEADTVELTAQERRRARRRVVTRAGRVFTILLPPGEVLAPGALLHVGADFYVTVEAAAEALLAISPAPRGKASASRSRSAGSTPRSPSPRAVARAGRARGRAAARPPGRGVDARA